MKDYLIDICLVGLLIFLINAVFNDYNVQQQLFDQQITSFESMITNNEIITSDQGVNLDTSDNHVSKFFKAISDLCIEIIKTIVLIISNINSTLL